MQPQLRLIMLLAGVLGAAAAGNTAADLMVTGGFISGNLLYASMTSKSEIDRERAAGYVSGVVDAEAVTVATQRASPLFCIPTQGVTTSQTVEVVERHLREHPEQRQYSGAGLVVIALTNAFPCAK